jgi:protein-disulfide isomerase
MRRDITTARVLAIVGLALVVVVAVWSIVGIVSLSSQVASLSAKVDSLTARSAAPATPASSERPAQTPPSGAAVPPAPAIGDVTAPTGANASGAIVIGDPEASTIVEVYADYQCPYCQRWETEVGATLSRRALQPGSDIAVLQYNMAFLGESSRQLESPGVSARAANAAACVLEYDGIDVFVDFNAGAFAAHGGSAQSTRLDTASLLGLASQAGAGGRAFACIEDGRFIPFVAATTQGSFARGVTGTPTVLMDGVPLQDPFGDPRLRALLGG